MAVCGRSEMFQLEQRLTAGAARQALWAGCHGCCHHWRVGAAADNAHRRCCKMVAAPRERGRPWERCSSSLSLPNICAPSASCATVLAAPQRAARAAEMLAHASLDAADDAASSTSRTWLGLVDKLSEFHAFSHRTLDTTITVVLTERREDQARTFCDEVHELLIKARLNPLQLPGTALWSKHFRAAIQRLARARLSLALS